MNRIVFIIAAFGLASPCSRCADNPATQEQEKEKLKGKWVVMELYEDGKLTPNAAGRAHYESLKMQAFSLLKITKTASFFTVGCAQFLFFRRFHSAPALPNAEMSYTGFEFKGDTTAISFGPRAGLVKGRTLNYALTLDPSKKPLHIDLATKNAKIGFIGIYKLDGDTLTICWSPGRETRPEKFETSKKDTAMMLVLKRAK